MTNSALAINASNRAFSRTRHASLASVSAVALSLALAGCAVHPQPFTPAERGDLLKQTRAALYSDVAPVAGPITLDEAMARAVKYNLDHRVELMNAAVTSAQLDLTRFDLLPKIALNAGYSSRSNDLASTSQTTISHIASSEPAVSAERQDFTSQLSISWNVLDFAVGYIKAKQTADKVLIAEEQRRKVAQNIIQDVVFAYWRAVAAEHLLGRLGPVMAQTQRALNQSHAIATTAATDPLAALQYQKTLLTTLDRLTAAKRDLVVAKAQLASLMGLPPGADFTLAPPAAKMPAKIAAPIADLETVALLNRPELAQAAYQSRITASERRRILYESLLPSLGLSLSSNFDSNKYLINNVWNAGALSLAGNLMAIAAMPARLDEQAAEAKAAEAKRLALSMAVLAQVHVSDLRLTQAREEYATAVKTAAVEAAIHKQTLAQTATAQAGELALVQAAADDLFAQLRLDAAYAGVANAYAAVLVSVGADPLPATIPDASLATLGTAINRTLATWQDGTAIRAALASIATPVPAVAPVPPKPAVPSPAVTGGASLSLTGGGRLILGSTS